LSTAFTRNRITHGETIPSRITAGAKSRITASRAPTKAPTAKLLSACWEKSRIGRDTTGITSTRAAATAVRR